MPKIFIQKLLFALTLALFAQLAAAAEFKAGKHYDAVTPPVATAVAAGKIEVVAVTENHAFFKYMRAAHPENDGRFMAMESNPRAYWFDDYQDSEQFSDLLEVSGNGNGSY